MRSDLCSEAQPAISIECADLGSFGGEGQTLTTFFQLMRGSFLVDETIQIPL